MNEHKDGEFEDPPAHFHLDSDGWLLITTRPGDTVPDVVLPPSDVAVLRGLLTAAFGEWAVDRFRLLWAEAGGHPVTSIASTAYANRALGIRDAMKQLGVDDEDFE